MQRRVFVGPRTRCRRNFECVGIDRAQCYERTALRTRSARTTTTESVAAHLSCDPPGASARGGVRNAFVNGVAWAFFQTWFMLSNRTFFVAIALTAAMTRPASAQASGGTPPAMDHSTMSQKATVSDPLGVPMDRAGSGTAWIPDAVQLPTHSFMARGWHLMLHGFAFAQYDYQSSDRGDKQFGSLNWGMFMASRTVKGGRLQLRSMLSLDAATVGPRGYPLLAQSGELYNGQPVVDRQHPHDFLMELAVEYERPITKALGVTLYAAPSGEPALGPVAFMHRPSSMDMPTAPLGHHWQDATHVAFGVMTAGIFTRELKLEVSAFNGREPDQYRWDIDKINIDSYSARISVNPNRNLALTAGYGYLKSPEALHPNESLNRFVASAMYGREFGTQGQWATTFVYGRNNHPDEQVANSVFTGATARDVVTGYEVPRSHSFLLESEIVANNKNTYFGRAEFVRKTGDDLMLVIGPATPPPGEAYVGVRALSLGYVREIASLRGATLGIGGMGTYNALPTGVYRWYGTSRPWGGIAFLRVRPKFNRGGAAMAGMDHSKM